MIRQVEGTYQVLYKSPFSYRDRSKGSFQNKLYKFEGECENFSPDKCVFRNDEDEVLIVAYEDIIQMSCVKGK